MPLYKYDKVKELHELYKIVRIDQDLECLDNMEHQCGELLWMLLFNDIPSVSDYASLPVAYKFPDQNEPKTVEQIIDCVQDFIDDFKESFELVHEDLGNDEGDIELYIFKVPSEPNKLFRVVFCEDSHGRREYASPFRNIDEVVAKEVTQTLYETPND